jgi:hypothetical protein
MEDEAAALITRITEHHSLPWLARQLGLSERTLDRIRLKQVAATPDTIERLQRIAHQRPAAGSEFRGCTNNADQDKRDGVGEQKSQQQEIAIRARIALREGLTELPEQLSNRRLAFLRDGARGTSPYGAAVKGCPSAFVQMLRLPGFYGLLSFQPV